MVLLHPIVFAAAAPMLDLLAEHFGDGPWVRVVAIGGDRFRAAPGDGLGTAEEALGRRPVALRAPHRIHQMAIPIDRSIQIHPPTTHFYIRLILSAKSW
jgi:hypothetical protein